MKSGQEQGQVIPIFDFNPVKIYRRIKTKQLIPSETPPDMPFCPQFHNEGPNEGPSLGISPLEQTNLSPLQIKKKPPWNRFSVDPFPSFPWNAFDYMIAVVKYFVHTC